MQARTLILRGGRRFLTATIVVTLFAVVAAACADSKKTATGTNPNGTVAASETAELGPPHAATGSEINVGFVTAEDGPVNLPETREAAQAAAQYANDYLGGLSGHRIVLDICKDKSDGVSATACANKFVEDKVAAVVAGQLTNTDLYIPILQGAGIPWIIAVGSGLQEGKANTTYALTGGLVGSFAATAQYAKEHGMKTMALFGIDVPALTGAWNAIGKPLFQKEGVSVDLIPIPPGTPDATPQVTAALAKNPDGMFIVADSNVCKALLRPIKNANVDNKPVLGPDLCTSPDVISAVGEDAVDGLVLNGATILGQQSQDPEALLYRAVMKKYSPNTTGAKAGVGYIAMLAMVRAANSVSPSGDVTASSVLSAMRTAKDIQVPGYPKGTTFTCDGMVFPPLPELCSGVELFATIKGGQPTDFQVIDPVNVLKG